MINMYKQGKIDATTAMQMLSEVSAKDTVSRGAGQPLLGGGAPKKRTQSDLGDKPDSEPEDPTSMMVARLILRHVVLKASI